MNFQIDLRSFFLIVAAMQAFVFAVLLIRRGVAQDRLSDLLLAAFLVTLALTLSEHIAGWMGWYQSQVLTFFPFGSAFLFAPLAYLYVKSITHTAYRLQWHDSLHFVPAAVYFILHFSIWAIPVPEKLLLLQSMGNNQYFFAEGAINLVVLTVYTLSAIRHYTSYRHWLPTQFSNLPPVEFGWVRNFLIILAGICVVEWVFNLAGLFYTFWYDVGYWDFFIRAILLYYMSVAGYMQAYQPNVSFSVSHAEQVILAGAKMNAGTLPTDAIVAHLEMSKPYLNAELTLGELALQLTLPAPLVSQAINAGLGKNFNDLINAYRVQEVCGRLNAGEHKFKTLLGVALECGFNSKATFNRSFKKVMGIAPKEWLETQKSASQIN